MAQVALAASSSDLAAKALPRVSSSALILALLSALGLYVSLCHVYAVIAPDSDLADPVMLWQGLRRTGLSFLPSWYYNPDNYLLSLIPFTSAAFALFGTAPWLVVGSGWLILVACAALAAWICRTVTGAPLSVLVFPVLLLATQDAVGRVGFLGYAVTHNSSMVWGLLSLLASVHWLHTAKPAALAASAAALFVGAVSDPWLGPAMGLPLIGAGVVLLACGRRGERRPFALLVAAHLAGFCLARSQAFGLLNFLQEPQYPLADWVTIGGNLLWMGRILMLVFDPVPGARNYASYNAVRELLVLAPLGLYAILLLAACARRMRLWRNDARFVALTAMLSCAGTVTGFLITSLPQGPWMGRFFINVYVLLPVLAGLACHAPLQAGASQVGASQVGASLGRGRPVASLLAVSGAMAGLSMLGGLASHPAAWIAGPQPARSESEGLAAFLDRSGLHYGYGAHWGSNAENVTWLSGGRVRIRPVLFDPHSGRISPQRAQTSALWYQPSDRPKSGPVFVIVGYDPFSCAQPALCIAGVSGQFGAPDRLLQYHDLYILVWERPAGRLDDSD